MACRSTRISSRDFNPEMFHCGIAFFKISLLYRFFDVNTTYSVWIVKSMGMTRDVAYWINRLFSFNHVSLMGMTLKEYCSFVQSAGTSDRI